MPTRSASWLLGLVPVIFFAVQVSGECWIPGRCQGVLTNIIHSESKENCLETCQTDSECNWFTFDTSDGTCYHFNSCPTVDDSCFTCVSGESSCENEGNTKFLVVSGDDYNNDTEILELSSWPSGTCSKPDDLIANRYGGFLMTDSTQSPLFCGGRFDQDYFQDCQQFSYGTNQWSTTTTSMAEKRWLAKSLELSSDQWWITGGFNGESKLNSTEVFKNGQFSPGPQLPEAAYDHCIVATQNGNAILTGGDTENAFASNRTWKHDWTTGEWSPLPDLAIARTAHACGLTPEGRVFVAGGDWMGGGDLLSTEILTPDMSAWEPGPDLPFGVMRGASVQFQNQALIVGGYWDGEAGNGVMAFDGIMWVVKNQTLAINRQWHSAIVIPNELVQNCG
ncbi:hypothetical protein TCAL_12017 [Tigriopus californicus]|uniref:Apple domain-containing protein n=1 Tax=Tigriopus californicus TaxID=6832 RepID=A0A553NUA5_TIGCA|nr:kelch repeat-containing protein kel-10-like [Tigriopus californicus]TRY69011.1 hypothetical protein TCAL_12017 [Tigriopus californicus]|eukprot:TCALIF_12017-PA protein Name:"Similar to KLHL31 Kelch-like protein 31 (Homo sapiens)" AED:0.04 eAED:0.04 QI:0/1/0/1/1/1/2/0/392